MKSMNSNANANANAGDDRSMLGGGRIDSFGGKNSFVLNVSLWYGSIPKPNEVEVNRRWLKYCKEEV